MADRITIREFLKTHFRHFNAAVIVKAAESWIAHLESGGKMFLTLAGALSTGEIGISLAEMIRRDKVHGICATGANLEEDIFNLVAHSYYQRVPDYRTLTPKQELELKNQGMNRVTDTCIPEEEAMRRVERKLIKLWQNAESSKERFFPYEYIYQLIESGELKEYYDINPQGSWVVAACHKNIPIFTPGWEDSTLGNVYVANVIKGSLKSYRPIKGGLEQMSFLVKWYRQNTDRHSMGFFQIGGGIAGDFAICVVPLIMQDLKEDCRLWGYFAQISDSTTSYGSYSGATPNEKITWEKLDIDTPKFIIESDASVIAPLIFGYVLGS